MPLPPDCHIQNVKIPRTRAGDKFIHDLVLTIKEPDVEPIDATKLNGTIGIDVGFRKSGNTILIGTMVSDDSSERRVEIKVPNQMISTMEHIIDLQSELDDAATDLGKAITPLLKKHPLEKEHPKYKIWSSIANRTAHVTLFFEQANKFANVLPP